jgi:hypothetical protein
LLLQPSGFAVVALPTQATANQRNDRSGSEQAHGGKWSHRTYRRDPTPLFLRRTTIRDDAGAMGTATEGVPVHALSRPSIVPTTLTFCSSARPCTCAVFPGSAQVDRKPSSQIGTAAPSRVPMAEEHDGPIHSCFCRRGRRVLLPARSLQAFPSVWPFCFRQGEGTPHCPQRCCRHDDRREATFGRLLGTSAASFSHAATGPKTKFRRRLGQHQVSTLSGPSSSTIRCLASTSLNKFVVLSAVRLKGAWCFIGRYCSWWGLAHGPASCRGFP